MVEQVDRDDKKEDKAANEVVDNVLTSTLATTACTGLQLAKECLNLKNSKAAPPKMLRLIQNQLFESICARNICLLRAPKTNLGHFYYCWRCILGHILTFPDPLLPTWSNFLGPKWLVQGSHIQYYMFYVQLAPLGGIMSPLKSDLRAFWPFIYIKEIAQTKGPKNTPKSDFKGPKISPRGAS